MPAVVQSMEPRVLLAGASLDVSGNLTILDNGTETNTFTITDDGTNYVITDSNPNNFSVGDQVGVITGNGLNVLTVKKTSVTGDFTIDAGGGTDAIIVDAAVILAAGKNFDFKAESVTVSNAVAAAKLATTGAITIAADDITLENTAERLNATTVTLKTQTADRNIELGAATANAALNLTAAELGKITTGTLNIETVSDGTPTDAILVNADTTLAATTALNLNLTADTVNVGAFLLKLTTANSAITATTDNIVLDTTGGTQRLEATTVTLKQKSGTRAIDLGAAAADPTQLQLSDGELNKVKATTLIIGDAANSGAIAVSQDISLLNVNVPTLRLNTGSTVTGTAGGITATNLAIQATGAVTFTDANQAISSLAIQTAGAVNYTEATGFTIDDVGGLNGVKGAAITLVSSTGDIIVENSTSLTAKEVDGTGAISFNAAGVVRIDANATVETTVGGAILTADNMTLNGSIVASGQTVTLKQKTGATQIDLGANAVDATKLQLSDTELAQITATLLVIGDTANAGAITVTKDFTLANASVPTLHLKTAGKVTATDGGIAVTNLAISAGDDVSLTDANTNVTKLAVLATGKAVTVVEADGFSVDTVDSLSGIDGAAVSLTATTGGITIVDTGAAVDLNATGAVTLTADVMAIAGTIGAANQTVTLKQKTGATQIDLGANAVDVTKLQLSDTELAQITATLLVIGDTANAGAITVTKDFALVNASVPTLHLKTGGKVTATDGGIAVTNLAISAGDDVSLTDASTNVAKLAVLATGKAVTVVEADGFSVDTVDGLAGIDGAAVSLTATTGGITIVDTGAAVDLNATGAVTLTADVMAIAGTIGAANQTVTLKQKTATNQINLGSATDVAASTLELSDAELDAITATTLVIGDANSGDITVSADITPANIATLRLTTAGKVTGANATGGIAVTNLAIQAGDDVSLTDDNNNITKLAVSAAGQNVTIKQAQDLTIGAVDGLIGIAGADVSVDVTGDVTINGDAAYPYIDIAAGGTLSIRVRGDNNTLTNNGNIGTTAGGNMTVVLEGDNAQLVNNSYLGPFAGGDLTVTLEGNTAVLTNNGYLGTVAGGNVNVTLDGNNAVFNNAANGYLYTGAAGTISVALTGDNGKFTNGGNVVANTDGIVMSADEMALLGGTITANGQTVTIKTGSAGNAVDLGNANDPADNTLELSDAELDTITAGTIQIGDNAGGPITFSTNIDRGAATNIGLTTAAGNDLGLATFGLNANGGNITLTTTGTGAITTGDNTGSDLTGANVVLNSGSIGTAANNVFVASTGTLTTNTNANNGAQFLQAVGTVSVAGLDAGTGAVTLGGGTFSLSTVGSSITGDTTVKNGATLTGIGTTGKVATENGGTVAPGTSPGILNTGDATFAVGSNFNVEVGGTAAGNAANNHDQLNVTGAVNLGGATLNLTAVNNFVPVLGQTFTLIQNDGNDVVNGTFNNLAEGARIANFLGSGLLASISYVGGDGNDVVVQVATLSVTLVGGVLTITDSDATGKANNITVSVDNNGNLVLTDPNESFGPVQGGTLSADGKTLTIPLAGITNGLVFNGGGGNDTLTLNLTNMNLTTLGGVTFNGGAGGNDALAFNGGPVFDTITHNFVNANDGSVVFSGATGGTIAYTGLDPVTDNASAVNRVFTFTGADEIITLEDAAGAQSKISSTLGEAVTFNNPTVSLTINATNGIDVVQVTTNLDNNYASLTITGDSITDIVNLNADITFAVNNNLIVTAGTVNTGANADLITSGAGVITFTADDVALNASSTLQSAATVTIKQQSNGREVDLGTNIAGKLSLTDAELKRITANKLVIGDGTTGNVTVSANIAPTNVGILRLNNNGTVTGTAGGIAVANLGIQTTGAVLLTNAATNLTNIAVDTTNDNVTVVEADGFTVGAVDGLNGIDGAVIALTATTGNLTVANTPNPNDIDATALVSFNLLAADAVFTLAANADVETTAGGVSVTADNMVLQGTITSPNLTTTLKQQTAARVVSLGVETGGQLSLTDPELDNVTAQKIVIGDAATGIINVAGDIDAANTNLLRLNNNAAVNATVGGIVETGLAIQSTGVVNITDTTTNVTNLAIISLNQNVTFVDADGFTITAVDGLTGIDGAAIALTATTGNITVNNTAAANDVNGTGAISFTLSANDALFTTDATADVETTAGGVAVNADKMVLNGTITAAAQTVALKQGNGADAINLGSATDAAANTLELSDAELDRITAGTLAIGDATSGAITISADITRPAATVVNLTSGTDINITGGLLNTGGGNATLTTGAAGNVRVTKTGVDVNTGAGTLAINGGLFFTINGLTADTNHDQLNVVGLLNLTNAKLAMTGTLVPKLEETVTLVNNDLADAITGVFTSITAGGTDENGGTLQEGNVITQFLGTDRGVRISYVGGTGNDVVLSHLPTIVEIDANGDLIVKAEGGSVENLTFTLVNKGKSLQISDPTGNVVSKIAGIAATNNNTTVVVPLNLVTGDEIIVNTFGGDDVIRFGGGKFNKALRIDGGTDADDVRTTGALNITSSAALDNSLELGSGGTARLGGAVTANRGVEVIAEDDVAFSGIKASTLVNLDAGAGNLTQTGGLIQASMAQLNGDAGVGSGGGFIKTKVTNVGANSTNGGVFIQESDGVIVGGDPALTGLTAGGDLEFRARNIRTEDVLESGGDMRIKAEGYTNINADITATGTIWWRSVGGITQEGGIITADGLAIASKTGSVILEQLNEVNTFSASAKTKGKGVFFQNAIDLTIGSFDGGGVFTTPIEGILAGGNIEILGAGNIVLDGPLTADKAVRIETTNGDITQTANGRVKAKALGAKATGNIDLTAATSKVKQFASDAGGVAGTIDNVTSFSEGTLAAGRLVGEITTP